MSTEQLTGLQLAVTLLAQIGNDDSDRAIAAVHDLAEAHAQRLTLQHHQEHLELAALAAIEAQEPVAWSYDDWFWSERGSIPAPIAGSESPLYARPVPAQAVPESVDGLVSVFCYDEVLTFTFCDEAAADRFAGRFDPSVDRAEAPEHKA